MMIYLNRGGKPGDCGPSGPAKKMGQILWLLAEPDPFFAVCGI